MYPWGSGGWKCVRSTFLNLCFLFAAFGTPSFDTPHSTLYSPHSTLPALHSTLHSPQMSTVYKSTITREECLTWCAFGFMGCKVEFGNARFLRSQCCWMEHLKLLLVIVWLLSWWYGEFFATTLQISKQPGLYEVQEVTIQSPIPKFDDKYSNKWRGTCVKYRHFNMKCICSLF